MLQPGKKIPLEKLKYEVRASQATLTYGVGAMVDFPAQTLMTAAPEYWENTVQHIHDQRLEKLLGVEYFGMPVSEDGKKYNEGLSYVRFPEWYFCPKCRKFQPIKDWVNDYKKSKAFNEYDENMLKYLRCSKCYQELVVARIITVCNNGHISDFPWVEWTHINSFGGVRPICNSPSLRIKTSASTSEGLESITLSCDSCGAKASLSGAFTPNIFNQLDEKTGGIYQLHCNGHHPWKNVYESCNEYPRTMQRGSSSVYFPITVSSLVIPPYSSKLTSLVLESSAYRELQIALSNIKCMEEKMGTEQLSQMYTATIETYINKIALELGVSDAQVKKIIDRRFESLEYAEDGSTWLQYKMEEYQALSGEITAVEEDHDFKLEEMDVDEYQLPFIKRISLIHKIREVQALTGFSRVEPIDREDNRKSSNVRTVCVKEPSTNWYPGYEVRGEGIFIELDSDFINEWRSCNSWLKNREEKISRKYAESFIGSKSDRKITSKFLLLHTLSHSLLRQLSFECGYSIASLKERIYCSEDIDGKEMSGILIYTASGDAEGTLGGLVRQGRPDVFPNLIKKAVTSAKICSNDPICSLSEGQGRESLNLAACHSCTLLPETSCEEYNVLLDRGVLVGTFENPDVGFFSKALSNGWIFEKRDKEKPIAKEDTDANLKTFIRNYDKNRDNDNYDSIWKSLNLYGSECEKKAINELLKHVEDFNRKERPVETVVLSNGKKEFESLLAWSNSKVLFFSSEYNDEYGKVETDWKCFSSDDSEFNWQQLLDCLEDL